MKNKFFKGLGVLALVGSLFFSIAFPAISWPASNLYQTSVSTDGGRTWDASFNGKRYSVRQTPQIIFKLKGLRSNEYDPGLGGYFWFDPFNVALEIDGTNVYNAGGTRSNYVPEGQWTMNTSRYSLGKHDIKAIYNHDFDYGYKESFDFHTIYLTQSSVTTTALSLLAAPRAVKAGQRVTLTGRLRDKNGKKLAGKKIKIKANGNVIGTAITKKGGIYTFRHRPKKTTKYQAVFGGDASYQLANSKPVKVTVKK